MLAGVVATLVTVAIERFGGVVGGIIGTLPTTIVPAGLGMWDGDTNAFGEAMGAVPAGMLLNAGFLWLWRVLPGRFPVAWRLGPRLSAMTIVTLLVWCAAAVGLVGMLTATRALGVPTPWIGAGGLGILVVAGALATWTPRPAPRGTRRVPLATLVARGVLAALAIGLAVLLKQTGDPLLGGVAAVFPAIFVTTMVSLWLAQGEAVPAGAVGPMMLGSASVGAYALLAIVAVPALGLWVGSAVAWVATVVTTTLPAYAWLRRRSAG